MWQLHLWDLCWGWVKTDSGLLRLPRILYILMFWSDPGIMCNLCNFSYYSCTSGRAGRYFVCLQESVSALGFVFHPVENARIDFSKCFSVYICVNMSRSTLVWQYSTLNVGPWQNALCLIQLVWFCTYSDAGEDEGDLDFSALLKAAKWESWYCFVYLGDSMILSFYFVLLLPYMLINPLLFGCKEEEETWKRRTRDRCVGTA